MKLGYSAVRPSVNSPVRSLFRLRGGTASPRPPRVIVVSVLIIVFFLSPQLFAAPQPPQDIPKLARPPRRLT